MRGLVALVVFLTALLVGGFAALMVGVLKDRPEGASSSATLTNLPLAAPSANFAPHSLVNLENGFALLLVNRKTAEWEVRIFADSGASAGGIGAYRQVPPRK